MKGFEQMTVAEIHARNERISTIDRQTRQKGAGSGVAVGVVYQTDDLIPVKPKSKYHNQRTEVDGILFDSKKESERYLTLKLFQKAGQITDLQHHRRFALVVRPLGGDEVRIGDYETDFTYLQAGLLVVEDVKSPPTRKDKLYRWKKKHFESQYAQRIIEI